MNICAVGRHSHLLFFEEFIRQVGGVLERLERQGLSHGDLHDANILVSSEDPQLEFTVIDPSPGLEKRSPYSRDRSDFEWFNEHLSVALLVLQRHLPTISIQKHLGPKLFSIVNTIMQANQMAFADVLRLLDYDVRYEQWQRERAEFIAERFKSPKPLGLLRWEEIADPAQAVELFEPYPELFRRVRRFGNSVIVGARGSGKSTYLAALAYFPGAPKRTVEPSEILGVLFSCRQGEFKQISRDFVNFDATGRIVVKHVLVLKIIRRLMAILDSATNLTELAPSTNLGTLYDFVRAYLPGLTSISRTSTSKAAALHNLAAGVVRWEEVELQRLFAGAMEPQRLPGSYLTEAALLKLCELVRSEFATLGATQFYFLFDDAGEPNIPRETQQVLNDLVTSSNAVFCVKLSAERFSYDLRDSSNRTIEETHDFTSFDIASAYGAESGIDQTRMAIKNYFAKIVQRRLEHWNYPSHDISAYLGDQIRPGDGMLPVRELVRRLAAGRKDAYYAGWEVVWQLADKTARNLIELVSEIFAYAKVQPRQRGSLDQPPPPDVISARIQDRAIRAVSSRRLRGLEFTPGEITIRGQLVPLGRHLYLCASSFGAVSHRYLVTKRHRGPHRFEERLAIERNDTAALPAEAQTVLQLLVRYGIFDDSSLNVAFDDRQKKPVYVFNRIFCPAFAISFRRDAHIRLSVGKFTLYLMDPGSFVKRGTKLLAGVDASSERHLWDDEKR